MVHGNVNKKRDRSLRAEKVSAEIPSIMANVARLSKQNTQKNYSKELLLPPNGAGEHNRQQTLSIIMFHSYVPST